jgi:hypothetical protein
LFSTTTSPPSSSATSSIVPYKPSFWETTWSLLQEALTLSFLPPAKYAYKGRSFVEFLKWLEEEKELKKVFVVILSRKYSFMRAT